MKLLMIGLDHRHAPVPLRERFALDPRRIGEVVRRARLANPRAEVVALSTCNRVEVYVARDPWSPPSFDQLCGLVAGACGEPTRDLRDACLFTEDAQAAARLIRVACGMESMAVGETEVLGQVRRAYAAAVEHGAVGPALHRVFQAALRTAKSVRSRFPADHAATSVAAIAVRSAQRVLGTLEGKRVLVIGSGDAARHALGCLAAHRPAEVVVAGRCRAKAQAIVGAQAGDGPSCRAVALAELGPAIIDPDAAFCATSAPHPVLLERHLADPAGPDAATRRRVVVDMAVPRDVDPRVGLLPGVTVLDIDDLKRAAAAENRARGYGVADGLGTEIEAIARDCLSRVDADDSARLIRRLRRASLDAARVERDRTVERLGQALSLTEAEAQTLARVLDEHTRRMVNKVLHRPVSKLGSRANPDLAPFAAAGVRHLFFDDDGPGASHRDGAAADPASPATAG